jgi:hypothetical protein
MVEPHFSYDPGEAVPVDASTLMSDSGEKQGQSHKNTGDVRGGGLSLPT